MSKKSATFWASGRCRRQKPEWVGSRTDRLSWTKRFEAAGFARPSGRRRSCGAPAQARSSQMIGTAVSENNGALAQLGEHLLCKQGVIGSIPISSTIFLRSRMSGPSGLCSAGAPNGRRRAVALAVLRTGFLFLETFILEKKVCTAFAVLFCIHCEEKIVSESCSIVAGLHPRRSSHVG